MLYRKQEHLAVTVMQHMQCNVCAAQHIHHPKDLLLLPASIRFTQVVICLLESHVQYSIPSSLSIYSVTSQYICKDEDQTL